MTDSYSRSLMKAMDILFDRVSKELPYQLLIPMETPMFEEVKLIEVIKQSNPVSKETVSFIRSRLNEMQAYCITQFACRMAIHSARTGDISMLHAIAIGFVVNDSLIDWRDILVDLSIIEDCAIRLGTKIDLVMKDSLGLASDRRRHTIEDYLCRSPGMRGLEIMKITVSGSGKELTYTRIPWS